MTDPHYVFHLHICKNGSWTITYEIITPKSYREQNMQKCIIMENSFGQDKNETKKRTSEQPLFRGQTFPMKLMPDCVFLSMIRAKNNPYALNKIIYSCELS